MPVTSHAQEPEFVRHQDAVRELTALCGRFPGRCMLDTLGQSEEGRPIVGMRIGTGPLKVSLVAGAHSDEPVGPVTLRTVAADLLAGTFGKDLPISGCSFFIVPNVNPDGEERNRGWIDVWPDVSSYLSGAFRELPGRDVEFAYPDRRAENRAVSAWLAPNGPYDLHLSLHGMGFSDGAMLLVERNWTYRTEALQAGFVDAAAAAGLRMHDHNRKGEKGFFYVGPGFTTTPEGAAMRRYFLSHGDPETASRFGDSSMEFVRSLGGDPLCLVTELPLFLIDGPREAMRPTAYLAFKTALSEIRLALEKGEDISPWIERFGMRPLPLDTAVSLQRKAIELGIAEVAGRRAG